jgi:hypothetical protein
MRENLHLSFFDLCPDRSSIFVFGLLCLGAELTQVLRESSFDLFQTADLNLVSEDNTRLQQRLWAFKFTDVLRQCEALEARNALLRANKTVVVEESVKAKVAILLTF